MTITGIEILSNPQPCAHIVYSYTFWATWKKLGSSPAKCESPHSFHARRDH